MTMRFFTSLTIFAIACILQFSFMPVGVTINFIFATLIAFSFVFSGYGVEFWEFIFFILASIFLVNWLPVPSFALAAFAAIEEGSRRGTGNRFRQPQGRQGAL